MRVGKKFTQKLRAARAQRRNSRFPYRALGQGFLKNLVALTARIDWENVDLPIYSCWNRVMEQLWPYYGTETYEGRILLELANFAPLVHILVSAIQVAVNIVRSREAKRAKLLTTWLQKLQAERDRQMKFFEEMLQDSTRVLVEIGDESKQLKFMTRLKHSVESYGDVLTEHELDVISAVYDTVARLSDLVVVETPEWFTTSEMEWEDAQVSALTGGEEECLRAVSIWGELNHPNIRKFFGACHVGNPLIVHEKTLPITSRGFSWDHMLDAACGLAYLHDRGLVHTALSTGNIVWTARQQLDGKAVLSGINLVRMEDASKPQLVKRLRARRQMSRYIRSRRLGVRPKLVREEEWGLLVGMCAEDPADRMTMLQVVNNIDGLARKENGTGISGRGDANAVVTNIDAYTYNGGTISDMLEDAETLCNQLEESSSVHQPVLDRIVDIYKQLQNTVVKQLEVEDFVLILSGFIRLLDDEDTYSSVRKSWTIAGKNYSIHHHIDRFLARSPLNDTAEVHHWHPNAQYSQGTRLVPIREHEVGGLPTWLIPVHQIELGRHLASGSFGAVYEGTWLGSKVVVKQVLTDQADADNRNQFKAEADLWFSLNHDHIIKLYGACHDERPFFVCERATRGTLTSFAKGKERLEIWSYIHQALLGLRHLHDHGIVHGDLKGNNILVCDDGVKLADFGMSFIANRPETVGESNGALGAFRWKAPECLKGEPPSFASDIYSFGMTEPFSLASVLNPASQSSQETQQGENLDQREQTMEHTSRNRSRGSDRYAKPSELLQQIGLMGKEVVKILKRMGWEVCDPKALQEHKLYYAPGGRAKGEMAVHGGIRFLLPDEDWSSESKVKSESDVEIMEQPPAHAETTQRTLNPTTALKQTLPTASTNSGPQQPPRKRRKKLCTADGKAESKAKPVKRQVRKPRKKPVATQDDTKLSAPIKSVKEESIPFIAADGCGQLVQFGAYEAALTARGWRAQLLQDIDLHLLRSVAGIARRQSALAATGQKSPSRLSEDAGPPHEGIAQEVKTLSSGIKASQNDLSSMIAAIIAQAERVELPQRIECAARIGIPAFVSTGSGNLVLLGDIERHVLLIVAALRQYLRVRNIVSLSECDRSAHGGANRPDLRALQLNIEKMNAELNELSTVIRNSVPQELEHNTGTF
ncbi:hypothetical protein PR003_g17245 [Phytophthora rubi]|uniref:Protein kinase domain-containing protein n=1 Tax=Phytophthora rubi TaxID=129364 RepID=A0A6A4EHE7_9STRA|nr:hypothetical protein PR003_g17245 [Phytophthora rubi]